VKNEKKKSRSIFSVGGEKINMPRGCSTKKKKGKFQGKKE